MDVRLQDICLLEYQVSVNNSHPSRTYTNAHITHVCPYRVRTRPIDSVRLADCLFETFKHHRLAAILGYADALMCIGRVNTLYTLHGAPAANTA